jgi:hypothetical protein
MSPTAPQLADPYAIIRGGTLPKKLEQVCFALDLVEEYETLQEELTTSAANTGERSLGGGARIAEIRERLAALQDAMRAQTVTFTLQALPSKKFKALKRDHPPRKDDDGFVGRDGLLGVNEETFFEPLLKASIVDPVLNDEMFRTLVEEQTTDATLERLTTRAWFLNVRQVDVPFSLAASTKSSNSAPE